ncbi:hypothetical protein CQA53_10095 [Helicobacter didelphidarum]|uniref:Uncharacterized protein n=1 Tax=Helicobacter didelphidarum TaxID=2040648 RepID=A0A3D8I8M8_9HELI|nr:hypothetical protein [Helicobacter didelphidarum]RDU61468.1 hypothetical protein CQA53_10095 [Helicobacter didelphidarum]
MKKLINKLNAKLDKMLKTLQKLTWKQAFLFAGIPAGIIYILIETYQEIAPYYDKVVERKQDLETLYNWYQYDYKNDLEQADKVFQLSLLEAKKYYPHNPDPTIPLIYKLPQYITENPNDDNLVLYFTSYIQVHMQYFFLQTDINEATNHIVIKPQEMCFINELYNIHTILMQVENPQRFIFANMLLGVLSAYLTLVEKNKDYCEIWGDLRNKLQIITHDINLLLANNTPNFDKESLDKVTKNFTKMQQLNKNLRTCQ